MSATPLTVASRVPAVPKHIKVNGKHIRLRLPQQVSWVVLFGAIAIFIVTAVYFDITQVHYHFAHLNIWLTYGWNHLINSRTWPDWRHGVGRAIPEGIVAYQLKSVLGGFTGRAWHKHPLDRVPVWSIPLISLGVLVLGEALAIGAQWVAMFGWAMIEHHSTHVHYVTPTHQISEVEYFLIGLAIGQLLHRLWRSAANTSQLYIAERGACYAEDHGGTLPFWARHPLSSPSLRERVAWLAENNIPLKRHGAWIRYTAILVAVVFFALAVQGAYIRIAVAG